MKKVDEFLNIQKAISINEQLRRELKEEQPKVIGQEGIFKRISELTQQRDRLKAEQNKIAKNIKELNLEIKKWENEISPNQTTLF